METAIVLQCCRKPVQAAFIGLCGGPEYTIKNCVAKVGAETASNIKGISVDTTGSSPVAVDKPERRWHCCQDLK